MAIKKNKKTIAKSNLSLGLISKLNDRERQTLQTRAIYQHKKTGVGFHTGSATMNSGTIAVALLAQNELNFSTDQRILDALPYLDLLVTDVTVSASIYNRQDWLHVGFKQHTPVKILKGVAEFLNHRGVSYTNKSFRWNVVSVKSKEPYIAIGPRTGTRYFTNGKHGVPTYILP